MRTYSDLHKHLKRYGGFGGAFGLRAYAAAERGDIRLFDLYAHYVLHGYMIPGGLLGEARMTAMAAGLLNRLDIIEQLIKLARSQDDQYNHERDIIRYAIEGAAQGNHQNIIDALILMDTPYPERERIHAILAGAAYGGSYDLLNKYYDRSELGTILSHAAAGGQTDIVVKAINLYGHGANINDALAAAAENGHRNTVDKLIELGADNLDGALSFAASGGHYELAMHLIELGADDLNDALSAAVYRGHRRLVNDLIKLGADEIEDTINSAISSRHENIIHDLIDLSAEEYHRTGILPFNLKKAIENAVGFGDVNVMNRLIGMGEFVDRPSGDPMKISIKDLNQFIGNISLITMRLSDGGDVVTNLIEWGADDIITPLLMGSKYGNFDVVRSIINRVNEGRPNRIGKVPTLPPDAINRAALAAVTSDSRATCDGRRDILLYLIGLGGVNLEEVRDAATRSGQTELVNELSAIGN